MSFADPLPVTLQHPAVQAVLKKIRTLPAKNQKQLISQLAAIDLRMLDKQIDTLKHSRPKAESPTEPFNDFFQAGSSSMQQHGWQAVCQGKAACLVVAGGQGSRLRFDGPKGLFPVTHSQKTLFQLFAEKTLAAGKAAKKKLHIAFMTSTKNHAQTTSYFKAQNYFGLDPDQIDFFEQGNLPFLSHSQDLFLESSSQIAEGPDGNGVSLKHLYNKGIWHKWKKKGVGAVIFLQIDNALADPFDRELLGIHFSQGHQATLKCIERINPQEKVGVVVKSGNQLRIVEYSEIDPEEMSAKDAQGILKHRGANISTFCFGMAFIENLVKYGYRHMPMHCANKAAYYLNDEGKSVLSEKPIAWKFEQFIFDVLTQASKTGALLARREDCYAPLKNFEGDGSAASVRAALAARDKAIYKHHFGRDPDTDAYELPANLLY